MQGTTYSDIDSKFEIDRFCKFHADTRGKHRSGRLTYGVVTRATDRNGFGAQVSRALFLFLLRSYELEGSDPG